MLALFFLPLIAATCQDTRTSEFPKYKPHKPTNVNRLTAMDIVMSTSVPNKVHNVSADMQNKSTKSKNPAESLDTRGTGTAEVTLEAEFVDHAVVARSGVIQRLPDSTPLEEKAWLYRALSRLTLLDDAKGVPQKSRNNKTVKPNFSHSNRRCFLSCSMFQEA